ncbi:MAG: ABC transporter ATP-binding protein [Candidatus Nanopelagicales bacterium]
MSDWLLKVDDLSVRFSGSKGVTHAVDGVSFEVSPGETLALVGETGCGKSVTARAIMRLVPEPPGIYESGSILLRSSDGSTVDIALADQDDVRRIRGDRISLIFQDPGKALNPSLTVGRQVAEVFGEHRLGMIFEAAGLDASKAGRVPRRIVQQRAGVVSKTGYGIVHRSAARRLRRAVDDAVAGALAETGIPNPRKIMSSYPHELSGGMKQRVMIAQALACDPDLLIADEPTTALDVTIQARILELIGEMQERRRMAIIYITHDLSLVREFTHRVAVMYAGRIVETGPSLDVLANPQHPYTQGLLASIPRSGTARGQLSAIPGSVPQLISPPPQCHFAERCPWAAPVCHKLSPVLTEIEPGRAVSCWRFHRNDLVADEMPEPASEWVTQG